MKLISNRRNSYLFSVIFHLLLALILYLVRIHNEPITDEYLLIGFGSGSGFGSPASFNKLDEDKISKELTTPLKNDELKKVELPKTINEDKENVINPVKKISKDKNEPNKVKPLNPSESQNKNDVSDGSGAGGFGFELDFGGTGKRRIYTFNLPEYPEGVAKEIDVKLRFTILPDGTVGRIAPLIKADARLENAAMNSLRQWRFEPLPLSAKQIEQTVVITFPYRLQ